MTSIPVSTSFAALVVLAKFDDEFQMLLLKRSKEKYWCHVAGHIESGETAWQAVIRELKEETSVEASAIYSASYIDRFYDDVRNRINLVPVFVTYVERNVVVQLDHEHTDYKWCGLEEAKALVDFPNMKTLYDFIWRHFVFNQPTFSPIHGIRGT